ncbi:hypothetical protein BKA70DRAFT_338985 [Coprinopsis sp. MPI-PUGE-AT-0042]|nr:hypothetical protein BKA70DRAFT_338985 [Coprinopsis sp. MPI-PUGE-AT-0042]
MSEYASPPGFDAFDYQNQNLDSFLSFYSPCDIVVPTPGDFEFDIDTGLEGFDEQLQVLAFNQNSFAIPRGSNGPLSTITTSGISESNASDDLYSDVSSFYGPLTGNEPANQDIFEFAMDFQRVNVAGSDYGAPQSSKVLDESDPTSFGQLPPTPPRSPAAGEKYQIRSSFSDYGPAPRRSSLVPNYFNGLDFDLIGAQQGTVSPLHLNSKLPSSSPESAVSKMPVDEDHSGEPRRKYKCNACPRSFARAYNLKTHMATHDPNRLKPHVCPHRSCGRSFSRKHDLGRHLVSIHRDEKKDSVGVASGARTWCDDCGKGTVGREASCDCADVK